MNDYEPTEIVSGDPIEWRKSLDDYKAGDGWALTYYFRGRDTGFDATGTPDGDAWIVSATAPTYSPQGDVYEEGKAVWQAWVSKDSEKHLVGRGEVRLLPSLQNTSVNTVFDGRTQAERDLDAVRAALVPATSVGVQEYEIGGVGSSRRLRNYNREDLLRLEESLAQRVNAEKRRAAREKGATYFKTIYPR